MMSRRARQKSQSLSIDRDLSLSHASKLETTQFYNLNRYAMNGQINPMALYGMSQS
jgi:hypothetical protein